MATIGTFWKTNATEYRGEILTLSLSANNIRIVSMTTTKENAPSHRVYAGRVEIGAAWQKQSEEGRDYLSVKLDDPSFREPIYANLVKDEGENDETFSLIWSRPNRRHGD